jgi:DNA-binding NtrC family response regulator
VSSSSLVPGREGLQELTDAIGSAANMLMDRGLPLGDALSAFEFLYLREAVQRCHGNLSQAAAKLGIHRNTLRSKLQRNGDSGHRFG